jgi:hypothetical protein
LFGQQPWWPAFLWHRPAVAVAISLLHALTGSPAVAGQSAYGRSVPGHRRSKFYQPSAHRAVRWWCWAPSRVV